MVMYFSENKGNQNIWTKNVYIVYTRPLPLHMSTHLNTCTSNNISILPIQNLLNLHLTKSKQGSPLSPNAALP